MDTREIKAKVMPSINLIADTATKKVIAITYVKRKCEPVK